MFSRQHRRVGCFFQALVCRMESLPHRPAKPRGSTGFSLPNPPPTLHEERKLWRYSLPFGGFEAHEDKDFDSIGCVTADMLVGWPIYAWLGIGSPFDA